MFSNSISNFENFLLQFYKILGNFRKYEMKNLVLTFYLIILFNIIIVNKNLFSNIRVIIISYYNLINFNILYILYIII